MPTQYNNQDYALHLSNKTDYSIDLDEVIRGTYFAHPKMTCGSAIVVGDITPIPHCCVVYQCYCETRKNKYKGLVGEKKMQICYSNFTYMSERKHAFKTLEAFLVCARNWDMNKKISWEKITCSIIF